MRRYSGQHWQTFFNPLWVSSIFPWFTSVSGQVHQNHHHPVQICPFHVEILIYTKSVP
jgi:hypothetical protein